MAADAMNDAWDAAADAYEKGGSVVSDRLSGLRPTVDATTDELRAKIDLARERMDQLRSTLSDNVAAAADTVTNTATAVADKVGAAVPQAPATEAVDVHVEESSEDAEA